MREKILLIAAAGSYPKLCDNPKQVNLRRALNRFDRGEISAEELEGAYRANITRVVKDQVAAGLDVVTDGQVRWDDLLNPFARNMEGVKLGGLTRFFDNNFYYRQPHIVDKVALKGPVTVADFNLACSVSSVPVKPVVVGPFTFAKLCADEHYRSIEKLTLDLARALNQELVSLQAAGARMIQVDEPSLCFAPNQVELAKEALALMTEGVEAKITLCLYFGGIKKIWPRLLTFPASTLAIDLVSHEENLDILKDGGTDKELALGVIDARNTKMEDEDDIINTLNRAAQLSSAETIYLSPNCGLEFLPYESARRKMELMVTLGGKFRTQKQ